MTAPPPPRFARSPSPASQGWNPAAPPRWDWPGFALLGPVLWLGGQRANSVPRQTELRSAIRANSAQYDSLACARSLCIADDFGACYLCHCHLRGLENPELLPFRQNELLAHGL